MTPRKEGAPTRGAFFVLVVFSEFPAPADDAGGGTLRRERNESPVTMASFCC
jgi:hypothetical protein